MIRLLALAVILVVPACSRTPATEAVAAPAASSDQQASTAQPVPAQLPDVVTRVNGEDITRADFERAVEAIEARAGGPIPPEQRDQVLRDLLEQLVGYRLMLQEARARKILVADAEVDGRMEEIRSQFPSENAFTEMLAQRKLALDQVRTDARNDMLIDRLLEAEVAGKAAVTPEQITDFYAKNPGQFQQGESVRASHILIGTPRGADAAAKAEARARAEQMLKQVRSGGDFAALARQHSTDPGSAANGGDLGFFQQGQMVGPFNDAAFTLAAGATSDLVETEFGFHIIRVAEKQAARTIPLDQVRPQLEQYLQQMNRQQQTEAFVKGLRSKGTIEVLM